MAKTNRVLVYSNKDNKSVYGARQSNQTILIEAGKLTDTDKQIIEDKYGHRYARNIALEEFSSLQVFTMI